MTASALSPCRRITVQVREKDGEREVEENIAKPELEFLVPSRKPSVYDHGSQFYCVNS
jgi:hypothetical protein